MEKEITFILNNQSVSVQTDTMRRLLDVLRDDLGITGTKEGCGEGECGACSVLLNGKLVNSCLIPVGSIEGDEVLTIEGFKLTKRFTVLEAAFAEAGAVQCGFCTPGMLMAAEALLTHNPKPEEAEIRDAISGNLCRCTGYNMIVEAIQIAGQRGDGLW
jgi:aerobic carbon-monoxide dehydrogenase small subunit